MSHDIVKLLRDVPRGIGGHYHHLMQKAADEIERLRLEMSIPRDEYAMTWKNLLDRIDGLDIVEWIRAYANAYSPSDYSSPIAREVVVRSDKRWLEAADEIERLREELRVEKEELSSCCIDRKETQRQRDEARREVCEWVAMMTRQKPSKAAKERNWDCFKEASRGDD